MYQKVLSRVEGPKAAKCCDMMFILPLELVEIVLQKLPFHTLMYVSQMISKFLLVQLPSYSSDRIKKGFVKVSRGPGGSSLSLATRPIILLISPLPNDQSANMPSKHASEIQEGILRS